jgi:hypothetical protein
MRSGKGPERKLLWPISKSNIEFAQNWRNQQRTLNQDIWYLIWIYSLYTLDIFPCLLLVVLILGIWWSRGKTLGCHSQGPECDSKSDLCGDFSEHRLKPSSLLEIMWKIPALVPPLLETMLICPDIHSHNRSLIGALQSDLGCWQKWVLNSSLGGQRSDRSTQTVSGGTR